MPNLKNMSAVEALRFAKEESGKTAEEVAYALGISTSVMNRYLRLEGGYSPSIEMIPKLCRAFGNNIMVDWLIAKTEHATPEPPARNRAEVLTAVARASAALGDVSRILVKSEKSGIDFVKAREIRAGLTDVKNACSAAQGKLEEIAAAEMMQHMVLYQTSPGDDDE